MKLNLIIWAGKLFWRILEIFKALSVVYISMIILSALFTHMDSNLAGCLLPLMSQQFISSWCLTLQSSSWLYNIFTVYILLKLYSTLMTHKLATVTNIVIQNYCGHN